MGKSYGLGGDYAKALFGARTVGLRTPEGLAATPPALPPVPFSTIYHFNFIECEDQFYQDFWKSDFPALPCHRGAAASAA
ncbi:hypothetical protein [Novosphingobium sp. ST904]|uniref:hypothetical protein n=1 Tax=Novosphingobium sp. ST904 TaxID=1684385 RepID=UPI0006C8DF96|nr:hypothetical protein [Novosphingobium sp. ST904]KPH58874.1 hypothetical protein ADT71_24805 [Novosphingobium sp. ST904]